MASKLIKFILIGLGIVLGLVSGIYFLRLEVFDLGDNVTTNSVSVVTLFVVVFGIIFYFISPILIYLIKKAISYTEVELAKLPPLQVVTGAVGLIIGLIIAYFISNIFSIFPIPMISIFLTVVSYLFFGYLGIAVTTKKFSDVSNITDLFKKPLTKNDEETGIYNPKILDTSVIIDGRIADIVRTGFLEGPIIIPEFVLKELRHVADSSDNLKRTKGRRGLDILKTIQTQMDIEVIITNQDFEEVSEVDIKLLKLAIAMKGSVVTNDYNLNKVADLQGVRVLNINELSNAVKPNAIPGEEMEIFVLKEGKENNQGVAYLDDGTMIVIEEGKSLIGQSIKAVVTSVLQTPAGRMIFVRPV